MPRVTRYKFNGHYYGRGRLVRTVIDSYVSINPDCTYADLEEHFPPGLQGGSMGVFLPVEEAQLLAESTGRTIHHFLKEKDLISLCDSTIAVVTHWGISNTNKFIEHAMRLGYLITEE
jgi:hypothetical protein